VHDNNLVDRAVNILFGGLRRWDAVYFLHIAEHGYTYENTLAFFPLFPLLVRLTSDLVLFPLHFAMNYASVLLIAAVGLNLVFFVLSAEVLYRLGIRVLGSELLARKAVQLYFVNPASIFFTAAYSESLYALVTFYGMLMLEENRIARSAFVFGVSSLARSNGLVNGAFVLYAMVQDVAQKLNIVWNCTEQPGVNVRLRASLTVAWFTFWRGVMHVFICITPFLLYQWYASTVFCNPSARYKDLSPHILDYGREKGYKMPSAIVSVWCRQTVPMSYAYVQNTHWNVGLLQYYQLKQLPNFALALPMLVLCFYAVGYYVVNNVRYCLTLGLVDSWDRSDKKVDGEPVNRLESGLRRKSCFVYIVHMTYLVIFALLYMHIQVVFIQHIIYVSLYNMYVLIFCPKAGPSHPNLLFVLPYEL